ncbi:membrane lipoprotein lipid attachment site-containing protein [Fictibacillus sp. BK138]|uniref:membrane lipoprotein lipid attachment site-containing protein n=1 Tax=Fictibacillus sp. BK138 TaxID=2512121 RepID=UPI001029C565|nr:membrane lipoprotein lipid attachment site-containing protein [Fictibacillus sp. BK138]
MKKYILASFLVLAFILSGCSDPVQDDLMDYINEKTPKLAEKELAAVGKYENVTGANYTNDETLYFALKDEIIPEYNDFINELEAVEIETDDLRKIHEDYIEAANIQSSAFLMIVTAIENQDSSLINEANEKLNTARKMIRDYQTDIDKLAKEHDVELEKTK